MKKGRPAHIVSALCDPALVERVAAVLSPRPAASACGRRRSSAGRRRGGESSSRSTATASASSSTAGRVKVEHDDAAAAAPALGRPLRDVLAEASAAEPSWPKIGELDDRAAQHELGGRIELAHPMHGPPGGS